MNVEQIREYCILKEDVEESLPFGPDTLVFKVEGKIFLLLPLDAEQPQFNVKCDPDKAEELRAEYTCVLPGYHMNKKHWNTILMNNSIPDRNLKEWIENSYQLVRASLPKSQR